MRRIIDLFQNTFLMAILLGLFALPLLVNLNLSPIVDESLAKGEVAESETEISNAIVNTDSEEVLGTARKEGVSVEYIALSKVFTNERVLQHTQIKHFALIKVLPNDSDVELLTDNLYLIRNDYEEEKTIEIKIDGENKEFTGLNLNVEINGASYQIYDGDKFLEIPQVVLDPGEEVILSVEAIYDKNYEFDGASISVRINQI